MNNYLMEMQVWASFKEHFPIGFTRDEASWTLCEVEKTPLSVRVSLEENMLKFVVYFGSQEVHSFERDL